MKYCYSILAVSPNDTRHSLGLIEAANLDEANGKTMRIAVKVYPDDRGWTARSLMCRPVTDPVVDPDAIGVGSVRDGREVRV